MPSTSHGPRRRWYQFSLLTFLLSSAFLATLLCGGLIWWQWPYQAERLVAFSSWAYEGLVADEYWEAVVRARLARAHGKEVPDPPVPYDLVTPDCVLRAPGTIERSEPLPPKYKEVYRAYRRVFGDEVKHGQLTVFDLRDGKKLREEHWRHGKLHGKWTDWHPDGSVLAKGEFYAGKKHGHWMHYLHDFRTPGTSTLFREDVYEHGTLKRDVVHERAARTVAEYGEKACHVTVWHRSGQKLEERTYRLEPVNNPGGESTGEVEVETYERGRRIGLARGWHENGALAYEVTWLDGREHGKCTWWKEDGTVDLQREFRNGRLVDRLGQLLPPIETSGQSDEADRLARELAAPTSCAFRETPLNDVVVFLSDLHGINIRLNFRALKAARISPGELLITRSLSPWGLSGGFSLRAALQILMEPNDLLPVVRHGMVLITTREDAASWKDRSGVDRISGNRLSPFADEFAKPTQFQLNETPLKDVCTFVSDLHGITVRIDPDAEDQLADTLITLTLSGVSLADALAFVLDQHELCCVELGQTLLIRPLEK